MRPADQEELRECLRLNQEKMVHLQSKLEKTLAGVDQLKSELADQVTGLLTVDDVEDLIDSRLDALEDMEKRFMGVMTGLREVRVIYGPST
jgi:type II secretory pathway predicted ATPase ExeA